METEAYLGTGDPASHAWQGRRRAIHAGIWSPPWHWYVYRAYGIHWCLNVTCGPPGEGAAVLIRGLRITEGIEVARRRRGGAADHRLADGPGKLTQALGVGPALDGLPVDGEGGLAMVMGGCDDADPGRVETTPRIGISRATDWPLRHVLRLPQ